MTSAADARRFGWHVGAVVPFGFYTNAQTMMPGFSTSSVAPHLRVNAKLVGLARGSGDVVVDDVDAGLSAGAQFTPALTRRLLSCCVTVSGVGVQLDGGSRDVSAVEAEIDRAAGPGRVPTYTVTSIVETKAERAIKPESIALAVFGGIVALAALLIVGQVIGRQLHRDADDLDVLPHARREPGDDDERRARRRGGRRRRRIAAGGCGRDRALAARPARPGALVHPVARHRVRLDGARLGCARVNRHVERDRARDRVPTRTTPRGPSS